LLKKSLPFFSYLFHPIFIPLIGTAFFVLFDESFISKGQQMLLLIQVFIITFLLPIAFFYLLKTFGKVENVMLSDISQRKIPLLLQIMLLTVLITRSITVDNFPELHFFFFGGLISSLLAFLLLYAKIKSSIHIIGMSALTCFLIGLSYHNQVNIINTILFFVIMTGVVASSRLAMEAHTRKELLIGFVCGSLPQLGLFYFWL
jgi:hypothetical protein